MTFCQHANVTNRTRQMFQGGKTKYTIYWKNFAVHQAEATMYCTQQIIQGKNFLDWLKTTKTPKVFPLKIFVMEGIIHPGATYYTNLTQS